MKYPIDNPAFYDLEVFPGYFMFGLKLNGEYYQYVNDLPATAGMLEWLQNNHFNLVGFNSNGYDDLVLTKVLKERDVGIAYQTSLDIIVHGVPRWSFDNDVRSIDLMPVLPGRMSLKKIGVCLGHSRLQELPIDYNKTPTPGDHEVLIGYNRNDLDITEKLYHEVHPELELRSELSHRYSEDLRSKGEATLAEIILLHDYKKRVSNSSNKKTLRETAKMFVEGDPVARVTAPFWWDDLVSGKLPIVESIGREVFNTPISISNDRLYGKELERTVCIGDRFYKMGVGGLHSVDGPGCWIPNDDESLYDIDVASYYPNIILTNRLYPRAWGQGFLDIYSDIVKQRMEAKRAGDDTTAAVLKIAANGTYGKSSDPYSPLYDPQLTANVTLLGQLGLMALIEMLEPVAMVVSANTDGISVLCNKANRQSLRDIVSHWEQTTRLEMEYTHYTGLWQKDVNNYLAVTQDMKVKQKGRFVDHWPDLRHTPSANIVATAVKNYLVQGVPVEHTIKECQDINQFVLTQNVTGSWTTSWRGNPLGKVLRFYKSKLEIASPIIRTPGPGDKGNEGIVSNSENCIPVEDLPDQMPYDMDDEWYIAEALELLRVVSQPKRRGLNKWSEVMHRAGLRPCPVDPDAKTPSRARVTYGDYDFSSLPLGCEIGTGTGSGLIARVRGQLTEVRKCSIPYPGKTRPKVKKDHGFEIYYGARVWVSAPFKVDIDVEDGWDQHYTPAELKKARS